MTMEERLEKLELELSREKRRHRWRLVVGALALGIGLVIWAFGPQAPTAQSTSSAVAKEIRANMFVLVDENGNTRGRLVAIKDSAALLLSNENGTRDVGLGLYDYGSRLWMSDENGEVRALLDVDKDGAGLSLFDKKGQPCAVLVATKDRPGLLLSDENGNIRALLDVDKDGPSLNLYDKKAIARCTIGATATTMADGRTTTYPESSIWLFGPDGKGLWSAP